jgi:hypothetical protein
MVYQNHMIEMLIQWKRWMATEIHLDHYLITFSHKRMSSLIEGEFLQEDSNFVK